MPVAPRALFRELEGCFDAEASKAGGAMHEEGKLVVASGLSLSNAERQELEESFGFASEGIGEECQQ